MKFRVKVVSLAVLPVPMQLAVSAPVERYRERVEKAVISLVYVARPVPPAAGRVWSGGIYP